MSAQHPPHIAALIEGALAAEDHYSLDELERYADARRTVSEAEVIGTHIDGTTCYHADRCHLIKKETSK